MPKGFSTTLKVSAIALTVACGSVSESDPSFWDPSRDLGGQKFGGFGPPPAGGTSGVAGSNSGGAGGSGSGAAGAGGSSGANGGNGGRGGTSGGSDQGGGSGMGGGGSGGSDGLGGSDGIGGAGGVDGTGGGGAGGTGPSTTCTLDFDFTTVTYRGRFGPKNIGAVWVMDEKNQFVKTLEVWADTRAIHLVNWNGQTRANRVDAVSGATLPSHGAHQSRWDCRDAGGNIVPNGSYTMFLELTEDDSAFFFSPQPKLFSFQFQKGMGPERITPTAQPNFTNMTLSIQ